MDVVAEILERGLIAVMETLIEERIFEWAQAVSKGGIGVLGVPITLPDVTEVVSDLTDEADLIVGVSNIRSPEQLSVAMASGADFILSSVVDGAIIEQAKIRGLPVIAGAFSPSEVHAAFLAGADLVMLHPIGAMGGQGYFKKVQDLFEDRPLLVSGGIDIENAPIFLELGARAAVVDTGLFPDTNDPAAIEVITMRAAALTEICSEFSGTPKRASFTGLPRVSEFPESNSGSSSAIAGAIEDMLGDVDDDGIGDVELAIGEIEFDG